MIIWVASYPRSGNTFFRFLLNRLYRVRNRTVYTLDETEDSHRLSALVGEVRSPFDVAAADSEVMHVVKTHDLPTGDSYPAIYLVRDGRDSLISYAHFLLSTLHGIRVGSDPALFREVLHDLIIGEEHFGGWSRNVFAWTGRTAPVHVVKFEELLHEPVTTAIAAWNAICPEKRAAEGVRVPTFDELHHTCEWFFRKGRIGSWQTEMPDDLHELFWKHHRQAMDAMQYPALVQRT